MMKYHSASILLFMALVCVAGCTQAKGLGVDSNICKSLVETRGYPCQEHQVITKDGYILGLQRIPYGRYGDKSTMHKRPPVLLQHGLTLDAASWLLNPPNQALAFMLADKGFDVWLANTRGTDSSRGHRSLSANDPAYWEWTWEQLAAYDLPAMFNYVNKQTGQKLHYVGHSLGTLTLLAGLSQQKLRNLLRSAALLSPIAHLSHVSTPLVRVATQTYMAEQFYIHGLREFPPLGQLEQTMQTVLCMHPGVECYNRMAAVTGPNCCISPSSLALYYRQTPQSTSTKNVVHLSQMIRSGTVSSFDYTLPLTNRQHYRQSTPPVYNMAKIPKDIPLFISFGGRDALSDVNDVKILLNDLKNHDKDKFVVQYINEYAHLDFVFGWNANQKVYDPMLAFFGRH
ncbi:PREDICTED: triacylglycerol lipase 2-like [Fragaria vesca subsp. vesca]|uniref:triacylglycerol lipase 2-like n=1 Tax=Fragaria vesca subsp. vesca TaxID=101020 RepID=UPI0002C3154C|nr:PREDICTED: triacylglycerol lipase 2-like [Fragaria vesca subsp. vesca]